MQRVVFDAYAIIAWLEGEPGGAYVASLIGHVSEGEMWGAICAVNIGEVYYNTFRRHGGAAAEDCLQVLTSIAWDVMPASNELVWDAARLKARYPISYADAFALACARLHEADLVTNDPELRCSDHGVTLRWSETEQG